ncbi:hypothetical protein YC2023_043900 [Brassica napus]
MVNMNNDTNNVTDISQSRHKNDHHLRSDRPPIQLRLKLLSIHLGTQPSSQDLTAMDDLLVRDSQHNLQEDAH